jgi:hypothetical protein
MDVPAFSRSHCRYVTNLLKAARRRPRTTEWIDLSSLNSESLVPSVRMSLTGYRDVRIGLLKLHAQADKLYLASNSIEFRLVK